MTTDYKWVWGVPDKPGIWAYGGIVKDKVGEVLTVDAIDSMKGCFYLPCWRCYLGPIPEVKKPLAKEELWFCQFSYNGEWVQFWVPEGKYYSEEFSNCPNKHKTTTTRYV